MDQIRATHHYGFRSGEWANLVCIVPGEEKDCYLVEFPDGVTDFWPVNGPSDPYEFRPEVTADHSSSTEGDE